ncbi:NUDIX domain-containing protein [Streptomyces sp. NA04227]|uniref:NUDIX hydrolase n=1 Tax=Streptomyces sp. NA04227 TaxID=2742136 RepID=UPI0015926182|nr:NUDIX domain-containing protein [Streptomyces sp. NA04227]QKW10511.1 NUDIX domain-containing protein [Streptomyces sp. NA04227]
MTEPSLPVPSAPEPSALELLEADQLRFVETPTPPVPEDERLAMNRLWDEAVGANPILFDGPVAACTGTHWESPRHLVVHWTRSSYRYRALRRVPGAVSWLPSLFVTVLQPTDDGRLLVGRMSAWTQATGLWVLPGGSVEPPDRDGQLDLAALRGHAARELSEETGIDIAPDALALGALTRGQWRNLGAHFLAPPRPARELRAIYEDFTATENALGREPELDRITFVPSAEALAELDGPRVDYLEPVVRRCAGVAQRF